MLLIGAQHVLGERMDPRMHGQLSPEQAAGEQHRGDPTSAGLGDEPAQVFLESSAQRPSLMAFSTTV